MPAPGTSAALKRPSANAADATSIAAAASSRLIGTAAEHRRGKAVFRYDSDMRLRLFAALSFAAAVRCTMTPTPPPSQPSSPSETIFAGGIVVAGPSQTAHPNWSVVTSGERIIAAGPVDEIRSSHPNANVINVTGATILPGLTDAHGHLYGLGLSLDTVNLVGLDSYDEAIARVKERAQRAQPGEWVLGRGWDQNRWPGKQFPTAAPLDA